MKFVKHIIIVLLLSCNAFTLLAQEANIYPQDYFLFPIRPGERNYLAGTMGELRPNHFHGGLDIKTGGVEGLPVRAAADGYVQRVKVNSYGYGWILYIAHPNGYVTTYAHLKKFRPDITNYVRSQQYNRESFSVDLFPKIEMLKVQKGDTIAWSGNTGSSGGPHLHFEIRDKNNKAVNPLLFGFSEILDKTDPSFSKVALECLDINARVEQKYGRKEYSYSRSGNVYSVKDTVEAFGNIGVDFTGYDRLDGASNKNGITYVTLECNNKVYFTQSLEKFAFSKGRTFNTHIDYKTYLKTGSRFQHCFLEDGNTHGFYGDMTNRGKLTIEPGKLYDIKITIKDSYKNASTLSMVIKGAYPVLNQPKQTSSKWRPISYTMVENVMVLKVKNNDELSAIAMVYADSSSYEMPLSYYEGISSCYLWDMRKAMPDSIALCDTMLRFNYKKMVVPGKEQIYSDSTIFVYVPPHALLDTFYMDTEYDNDTIKKKEEWRVGNVFTPLIQNVSITLKIDSNSALRHPKASVYAKKWNYNSYVGTEWTKYGAKFRTRALGKFLILRDEKNPYIKLHSKKSNYVSFKISDERSGIGSFRATLNGDWIMLNYDHKQKLIYLDPYYWDKKLKGDFKLVLKDNAGNKTEYTTTFQ